MHSSSAGSLGEPLLDPLADYSHAHGGISVIRGFGRLYFLTSQSQGSAEIREFRIGDADLPYGRFLKGFGEGADGEIYVCVSSALAPFAPGSVGAMPALGFRW